MNAEKSAGEPVVLALVLDVALIEDTVEAVQPAVRSPGKRIGQLVRVAPAEPGDDDLRLAELRRREVLERIEEDVGRIGDPDTAVADGDPGRDIEALDDRDDPVKLAVALGAFEDLDAILAGA